MREKPTYPWYEAAIAMFRQLGGSRVVEIVNEPVPVDDGQNAAGQSSTSLWCQCAEAVDSVLVAPGAKVDVASTISTNGKLNVISSDPSDFLEKLDGPVNLLYLDGWPISTPQYQERHADLYRAARSRLHNASVVLIGGTSRDYGGKARLVLPLALEDSFQILLWGDMTLLARAPLAAVRHLLPRAGPPVPGEASLDDAIQLHQNGLTWEAEQLYRAILREWPDHVAALHLLGVVRYQRGDFESALSFIGRAIALQPSKAAFFNNYGATLQGMGRYVEALACFHRALQLQPGYVDAISNLGLAQGSLGQDEAARASLIGALGLQPDHLDSIKRLADLFQKAGEIEKAVELYRKLIAAKPHPDLCINLAKMLGVTGRSDLAILEYQKAIDLKPESAEAWFNQGVACQDQKMIPESQRCFECAIELCPEQLFWRFAVRQ